MNTNQHQNLNESVRQVIGEKWNKGGKLKRDFRDAQGISPYSVSRRRRKLRSVSALGTAQGRQRVQQMVGPHPPEVAKRISGTKSVSPERIKRLRSRVKDVSSGPDASRERLRRGAMDKEIERITGSPTKRAKHVQAQQAAWKSHSIPSEKRQKEARAKQVETARKLGSTARARHRYAAELERREVKKTGYIEKDK